MNQAVSERETVIINALRIIVHTQSVDPDFVQGCIKKIADNPVSPGFKSFLEQDETEFRGLLSNISDCRSVLEIGSRYGHSILRIAQAVRPKSRIVAVDMPYTGGYGDLPPAEPILRESMRKVGEMGHDVHLMIGNSHEPAVVEKARSLGPYDFCFIDGDHSYEGVKADWENFGPVSKIVAFHDIVNNTGCFRLWNEIKKAEYRHVEYTSSVWLGIGIIFKD